MTAKPNKFCQFKRDYKQLIHFYPQSTLTSAQSLDNLNHIRHLCLIAQSQPPKKTLCVLGQWGLGDGLELLSFIQHWKNQAQAHTSKKTLPSRLLLKVFDPHPINSDELKLLWEQPQSLILQPHLQPLAAALVDAKLARIAGCQRLIFDDGRITLDLHFGELKTSVSELPHSPNHPIRQWLILPHLQAQLDRNQFWQMARLSTDDANIIGINLNDTVQQHAQACGFGPLIFTPQQLFAAEGFLACKQLASKQVNDNSIGTQPSVADEILLHERKLLRQQADNSYAFMPRPRDNISTQFPIAIIGGGLASAHLMLSLAERGQSSVLFCKDDALGQGASGNRQGAIYPLLTPENDELSQFFQQAFLFSRRRIEALSNAAKENLTAAAQQRLSPISHDFCGVLQTGHDERSQQRLDKIIQSQDWPAEIAYAVNVDEANHLAQISIDKAGFFYPLGGWVCPHEYTKAAVDKAAELAQVSCHFNTEISDIQLRNPNHLESETAAWYLISQTQQFGPFSQLVLANGSQLTQFANSQQLQVSPFRGQVSHIPAQFQLSKLATVLCANGYLTPSHQGLHCLGASYVKAAAHLDFCPQEQVENLSKMQESYPNQPWVKDINISDNCARVGVRMVTRDHFPMLGCAPDVNEIWARYEKHLLNQQQAEQSRHYWQTSPAPIIPGLYILGGLGSRGLSSGPLAAECLAAQLMDEPLPLDWPTLCKLNPNRMWLRKLLKGKAL